MKTTKYYQFRRLLPDRKDILDEWVQRVLEKPVKTVVQDDGRIRVWGQIEEANGRWLRVVVLEDQVTVHNAFFDRDFKE